MKKILMLLACASLIIAVTGCKEKTPEEKLNDAATQIQKDAKTAQADLTKDAEAAQKDAAKKLNDLGK